MQNRKMILGIALIAMVLLLGSTACKGKTLLAPKADPETDFEAQPIDGGKGVEIAGYKGDKWEVVIPSEIRGLPVTSIGNEAFQSKNLIKVTLPNSVTKIEYDAFSSNQLASVTIPNSVTQMGAGAFSSNQLTSITIPESITRIYPNAFSSNQLTSVNIPNSVTEINGQAFHRNPLTSITIGANVSIWEDRYFYGFREAYNNGGKLAGTYTRPNIDSATWTKQ